MIKQTVKYCKSLLILLIATPHSLRSFGLELDAHFLSICAPKMDAF